MLRAEQVLFHLISVICPTCHNVTCLLGCGSSSAKPMTGIYEDLSGSYSKAGPATRRKLVNGQECLVHMSSRGKGSNSILKLPFRETSSSNCCRCFWKQNFLPSRNSVIHFVGTICDFEILSTKAVVSLSPQWYNNNRQRNASGKICPSQATDLRTFFSLRTRGLERASCPMKSSPLHTVSWHADRKRQDSLHISLTCLEWWNTWSDQ